MKPPRPEDAWNSFLARLDLSRLPAHVELSMAEDMEGRRVKVKMRVADINDGSPLHVFHTIELPPCEAIGDGERLHQIIQAVNRAFEHEVRECIWLDGRRQSNPHFDRKSLVIWHAPRVSRDPKTGALAGCKCDQVGEVETVTRQADGRQVVTRVRLNNGEVIDPSIDIDLLREYESKDECPWGDRHLARGCC